MTPRQKQLYDFVDNFIKVHGFSPSYKEIAEGVGCASRGHIFSTIQRLIKSGHLANEKYATRGLSIVKNGGKETRETGLKFGGLKVLVVPDIPDGEVWISEGQDLSDLVRSFGGGHG